MILTLLTQLLQIYLPAFGAAIIWGLSPVIIFRVSQVYSSTFITTLRNIGSLIIAASILMYLSLDLYSVTLYIFIVMLLIGILGPGLGDQLYTISISKIGSSLSIIFAYTYVMWAQIFTIISGIEEITLKNIIGSLISIYGLYIVVSTYGELKVPETKKAFILGTLSSLTAGIFWGIATVLSKIAALNADPSIIILVRSVGAIIAVLMVSLLININYNSAPNITMIHKLLYRKELLMKIDKNKRMNTLDLKYAAIISIISGVLAFYLAYYLFLEALVSIGITLTTAITLFSPIVTVISSRLLIGEKLKFKTVLGILVVVFGLLIISI